jgi:hypothetical protein
MGQSEHGSSVLNMRYKVVHHKLLSRTLLAGRDEYYH